MLRYPLIILAVVTTTSVFASIVVPGGADDPSPVSSPLLPSAPGSAGDVLADPAIHPVTLGSDNLIF